MMRLRNIGRDLVRSQILPRPGQARGQARGQDLRQGQIVVAGMFGSGNGLGRAARGCLEALRALGLNPVAIDTSPILNQTDLRAAPETGALDLDRPGTLILYANPPELEPCLISLGFRRWHDWRIIGAWVWETSAAPGGWRRQTAFVSEVWAPSRFVAAGFAAAFHVPVRVVPHYLGATRPVDASEAVLPAGLALPGAGRLHILSFADARSSLTRKNPLGAVSMFRLAFPGSEDVRLTVKTQQLGRFPGYAGQLRTAIGGDPRIEVIDTTLSPDAQAALLATADIVLSPHRSEGFGLSLAEAMAAGKCVVATGWSGNLDFMNDRNAALLPYRLVPVRDPTGVYADDPAAVWADPDTAAGADILRSLARDPARRLEIGVRARETASEAFSAECYRKALEPLAG